jgi:TolB-like protein/Flp pilus assembly protein TadD
MARLSFGNFVLDPQRGTLQRDGETLAIGNKGLILLKALLNSRGEVVGKEALMDAAWPNTAVEESNLSVQIAALRKILGPAPDGGAWIATVPRGGYRFVEDDGGFQGTAPRQSSLPLSRPSIMVLPLQNASGDPAQEYLADGITEDIIIALSRFRWFSVVARNASLVGRTAREIGAHYLLEGSLRKSDQHMRISVQLSDVITESTIWAERYELELTEVFAIQDEIAERVAGAIEPELLKSEGAQAAARHTGNMTAWDLVRQGTWHFHQIVRLGHEQARELFRKACVLDPGLPEAHIWLARVNAGIIAYGWSDDRDADIREGIAAALTAIGLDERNPYAHYGLAIVSTFAGQLDQAIRAAQKAIEVVPTFALGHYVLGMARLFNGEPAAAIKSLEHGVKLSPYDPHMFVWYNMLAVAQLLGGEPAKARGSSLRALDIRPGWPRTFEILACCHAALGDLDEARRWSRQFLLSGVEAGDILAPLRHRNPHFANQLERWLALAEPSQQS